jgi:hypothetical protein
MKVLLKITTWLTFILGVTVTINSVRFLFTSYDGKYNRFGGVLFSFALPLLLWSIYLLCSKAGRRIAQKMR